MPKKRRFQKRAKALTGADNTTPAYDRYWDKVSAYGNAIAGVNVNHRTAEGVSAVYACVSAISETVASLPFCIYRNTQQGQIATQTHPLYALLNRAPNQWQTAIEFREMLQRHVLLRGNGYARLEWDQNGRIIGLVPMHPDRVTIFCNAINDRLIYEYTDHRGRFWRLNQDDVLHLRYHPDGDYFEYRGRSPIRVAREAVGLAIAEQAHGVAMFGNGAKLSGVIQTQSTTTPEQARNIAQSFADGNASVHNHGRTPVLPGGAEFKAVSMTLEDADFIESRKFSVIEICRLFRVPPVIIQSMEQANYSNSVELSRQFTSLTLARHLCCWEQAVDRLILNNPYYSKHDLDGLLRGDAANRASYYQRGIEDRWLLRSEVRQMENLPVVPGIDDVNTTGITSNTTGINPNTNDTTTNTNGITQGAANEEAAQVSA